MLPGSPPHAHTGTVCTLRRSGIGSGVEIAVSRSLGRSLGVWLYELLWDWQDQECAVPVDVVVRTDRCGY